MKDSSTQSQYARAKSHFLAVAALLSAMPLGSIVLPDVLTMALIVGVATLLAVPWEAMASLQGKHGKPEAAHKVNIWGAVIAVTSFTGAFAGSFVEVMMLPLGEFPTGTAQVAVTLVMWALDGLLARQLPSMSPAGSAGDLEG